MEVTIVKTMVVHWPKPTPKQVKGVRQQHQSCRFSTVSITNDGDILKYLKYITYIGIKINNIIKATGAFEKI